MRLSLRQAMRGWGRTSPNPMVGSVIVRCNELISSGCHHAAGTPHAEINALHKAGVRAKNSTLYVTLEPCSTHGRTGPCTEAIIASGITRVVIGTLDPNPHHAGNGITQLKNAGITTKTGVCEKACKELNASFFKWIQTGQPFVILKLAMTLDGRIATEAGISQWITGAVSRQYVQRLRRWSDAIMVGGETVRQDNPSLTVRTPAHWPNQPQKIVYSRTKRFSDDLKIWQDAIKPPFFVSAETKNEWSALLTELGNHDITALLIEGGGEVAANTLKAGIVDQCAFFYAPKIMGGKTSRASIGGESPETLDSCVTLQGLSTRFLGNDILVTGSPEVVG